MLSFRGRGSSKKQSVTKGSFISSMKLLYSGASQDWAQNFTRDQSTNPIIFYHPQLLPFRADTTVVCYEHTREQTVHCSNKRICWFICTVFEIGDLGQVDQLLRLTWSVQTSVRCSKKGKSDIYMCARDSSVWVSEMLTYWDQKQLFESDGVDSDVYYRCCCRLEELVDGMLLGFD